MRSRDEFLILGVAASLVLAVTLIVANTGQREPGERPTPASAAPHEAAGTQDALEEPGRSVADTTARVRPRAASAGEDDDGAFFDAALRRDGRRRETEALAEFQTLGKEQGTEALERAVRDVLASKREPLSRKVAALRALHAAGVPGTDAVLAAAVEQQPDASDGRSASVPRSALKLLGERAPSGEEARRALARLAFVQEAKVSPALRRSASTALVASIPGADRDEVVRLLRLAATPEELQGALDALSRDRNFGGAGGARTALDAAPRAGVAPAK